MEPLQWPEYLRDSLEDYHRWQTIVVQIASPLIRKAIAFQLSTRPPIDPLTWGDNPYRQHIARVLCQHIQKCYGWPNDRFLPQDPFDIVCLIPWDDLELEEMVIGLEEILRLRVPDAEAVSWCGKSLAHVVDSLSRCQRT